jgi:hypothetical protein
LCGILSQVAKLVLACRWRPHIGAMHLDLTDEEAAALTQELHDIVENDRYPFSPRIRALRAILAKLRLEPSRALAAAEGVCAAVERPIQAALFREAAEGDRRQGSDPR